MGHVCMVYVCVVCLSMAYSVVCVVYSGGGICVCACVHVCVYVVYGGGGILACYSAAVMESAEQKKIIKTIKNLIINHCC